MFATHLLQQLFPDPLPLNLLNQFSDPPCVHFSPPIWLRKSASSYTTQYLLPMYFKGVSRQSHHQVSPARVPLDPLTAVLHSPHLTSAISQAPFSPPCLMMINIGALPAKEPPMRLQGLPLRRRASAALPGQPPQPAEATPRGAPGPPSPSHRGWGEKGRVPRS